MLWEHLSLVNGFIYSKNYITDNAFQITSAVKKFDKDALRTNCWAHIYRLMASAFKLLPKDFKNEAVTDVLAIKALTCQSLLY